MRSRLKNITFSLPEDYIEKLREYSRKDIIPSMNAGIRDALENYFKMKEKMLNYEIMKEASSDKLLLNDINETTNAYRYSDSENNGGNENW